MSRLTPPVDARDHIRGNPSAPVILFEFGDFECPFCGKAYLVVKALERTLGDRLGVGFRHFPLIQAHPHAFLAAEAAEAAGAQGMFWPMHDVLFEHQDALELRDLLAYAAALGLDMAAFRGALVSHRMAEKIRADVRSGARSGVNGTPTFFINGIRHDGPFDFESLALAIGRAEAAHAHG